MVNDIVEGDVILEVGVKETTEVLKAVDAFVILLGNKLKDGAQVQDVVDILQEVATNPLYAEAAKGAKEVIPELADIDVSEGIGLGMVLLWGLPKYIAAFKKE
jgi:hypothetical protein